MTEQLHAWPASRLGEALETLARRCGLAVRAASLPRAPATLAGDELHQWLGAAAERLGVEVEPVGCLHAELTDLLRRAAPALVRLPGADGFLLVRAASRGRLQVIGPDLRERAIALATVRSALARELQEPALRAVAPLLDGLGLAPARRVRAQAALVSGRLAGASFSGFWLLRLPAGAAFGAHVRAAGLSHHVLVFAVCHALGYLGSVAALFVIGRGALGGNLDPGWLLAWVLLLATLVPLQMLTLWHQGVFAALASALVRRRLLRGALRLRPDEVRHQGAGHHLGRVLESETFESTALSGGFVAALAVLDLVIVSAILAAGAGGTWHALLLVLWVALAALAASHYLSKRRAWTAARLGLSHELLERMVGHRTRIAQEPPERWHEEEDRALARYYDLSSSLDRAAVVFGALPRGWLCLGLLALAPALLRGGASVALVAVSLGGAILAFDALGRLVAGLTYLADAAITWKEVGPLFHAAAREEPAGDPALSIAARPEGAVLEASEVSYRYPTRARSVLRRCAFTLAKGDRALLEGPSGGGKSTLVAMLNGLRAPDSGLVLLHGLDRPSLGAAAWARRVSTVPQFHDNHVLAESLAFNLLMGRAWPPRPEDLDEAEALCRELGLGPLLDQMPAGLMQMVGEGGWRLSHGQKSRLFLARALLQPASVVVLDESFGALDPESLREALDCTLRRAPALLVVAHP